MRDVLRGLQIIKNYMNEKELRESYFAAEHDQIWTDYNGDKMSSYDREMMDNLGWFVDFDGDAWSKYT